MRKRTPEEIAELLEKFNTEILPWCQEKNLSLHNAFEITRKNDTEKYAILSALWSIQPGKEYLRDTFNRKSKTPKWGK